MIARLFTQLPVRQRLTALYGCVFFLAGGLIVLGMYLLVTVELETQPTLSDQVESSSVELAPKQAPPKGVEAGDVVPRYVERADQTRREATLDSLLRQSLVVLVIVGGLAILIGHQLASRALNPLKSITATARRVADRSLHQRIALRGPRDEIKELADTFDEMLQRLDDAFRGQRHFVANASHELRTPLTAERTLIQVAMEDPEAPAQLRELGSELLDINYRSERLIESLLTLARSENAVAVNEPADLADLADSALAACAAEITEMDLSIHLQLDSAVVMGDRDLLRHLALNLVQNACRHNHERGEIWLSTGVHNGESVLTVTNTGRELTDRDTARIFDPFLRLGEARTGNSHGLGLSIVRSVAHSHNGVVTAEPRTAGGLTVTVRLPCSGSEGVETQTQAPA